MQRYEVATAVRPSIQIPLAASSDANLPALTDRVPVNRALYQRMDAVMCALDTNVSTATNKVGVKSPIIENRREVGQLASLGLAAVSGIGAGLYAAFAADFGWVSAAITGACAAVASGVVYWKAWGVGCNVVSRRRANQPPASEDLHGVRDIVKRDSSATEAAGLGRGAQQWLRTLEQRHVQGFEVQEFLGELNERALRASPAEIKQVGRWVDLRSAIATCVNAAQVKTEDLTALRKAFDALPRDEQRDIAPVLLEKLFRNEAPLRPGWSFAEGFGLNERLNRIANGLPVEYPQLKKANAEGDAAKAEADGEDVETPADAVAAPPSVEPEAASLSISTTDSSTIASLDGTVQSFEAALQPALKTSKKKQSVLPGDVAAAVAIAESADRTPVELVALGARASRFVDELNAREIYGYQARKKLLEIAKAAEQVAPELRDQIVRIDAYRAAVDALPAKGIKTSDSSGYDLPRLTLPGPAIDRILTAIDELLPCDRRMGAQRAYDRYFVNGVPIAKVNYSEAQRFLHGLRAHLKKI